MLDLIGTVILAAVIALNISAVSNAMPVAATARLVRPAVAGAWTGLAAAVAAAGVFADASPPFPLIGVFVAFPLVAVVSAALLFPAVRPALLGIPLPTLVGLNIARVFGGFFLLLAWADRLGGTVSPELRGLGRRIMGVLAIAISHAAGRPRESER